MLLWQKPLLTSYKSSTTRSTSPGKKRPEGMRSLHWKMQIKGAWGIPPASNVFVYHETKSSFAWIGEIEDEHLLAALEQLSDSDLELITLYAYEEYDTVEISKLFGTTKQNISKKIRRITNFIKDFQIRVV